MTELRVANPMSADKARKLVKRAIALKMVRAVAEDGGGHVWPAVDRSFVRVGE